MADTMKNTTAKQGAERSQGQAWLLTSVFIVLGFAAVAYGALREAIIPGWQDTEGFLGHGRYIAEHGALLGFFRESFAGTFPITERHPLYLLLLSPFASTDPSFFWTAKLLNLLLGAVVLVTVIWMIRKREGDGPALIAGALYAVSQSLVVASSHVNQEPLFVLCCLWTWWHLTSGPSIRHWALAGFWAALAYLTKSPAILMIGAVGFASLWHPHPEAYAAGSARVSSSENSENPMLARVRLLASARLWAFALALVVTASPLWIRNVIGYGTPLYEGVNSNIMWIDQWKELGNPSSIMYRDAYGIKTIERNGLPTAKEYFKTHSLKVVAKRLGTGFITETFTVARKALTPVLPLPKLIAMAWAYGVMVLAIMGWWQKRKQWEGRLFFIWTALFFVFFSWDAQLFPEFRYLAPLVPWTCAYAACALWRLLARAGRASIAHVAELAVIAVGVALVWTALAGSLTEPRPMVGAAPAYDRLLAWIDREIPQGGTILLGPSETFYGLLWRVKAPLRALQTPNVRTREDFFTYLAQRKTTHLVIHPENMFGWGGQLADALAPYWGVTGDGNIFERTPLPGWRQVYADPGQPRRFYIYAPIAQGER